MKNGDSKSKPEAAVIPGKAELSHEVVPPQPHSSESSKTCVMVRLFLKDTCSRNY